jgi:hypothetical protein
MKQLARICGITLFYIHLFGPGSTPAQGTGDKFFLTTYYWKPTTDGDVTVEGQTSTHSVDTRESYETSNFGGMIKGEKWYGKWGLAFDLLLIAIEDESRIGLTDIDTVLDTSITEFSFYWRIGERSFTVSPRPRLP